MLNVILIVAKYIAMYFLNITQNPLWGMSYNFELACL